MVFYFLKKVAGTILPYYARLHGSRAFAKNYGWINKRNVLEIWAVHMNSGLAEQPGLITKILFCYYFTYNRQSEGASKRSVI